jgi:transposase
VLANLRAAIEDVIGRHHRCLSETAAVLTARQQEQVAADDAVTADASEPHQPHRTRDERRAAARREQRVARYEEVHRLRREGLRVRQIADRMGLARGTVHRFLRAELFPDRAIRSHYPSTMDPYERYLRARWTEGCQNAMQLWREIQAMGYPGGRSTVIERLKRCRLTPAAHGRTAQRPSAHPLPPPVVPGSPRQMSWLFVLAPERLEDDERTELAEFRQRAPQGDEVYRLAQAFGRMVRARDDAALEPWLVAAEATGFPELVTFVRGIRRDRAAIDLMLTTRWSNGQTEGQVNRLKMLKRQMFGRANFDLLRQRVLYAG